MKLHVENKAEAIFETRRPEDQDFHVRDYDLEHEFFDEESQDHPIDNEEYPHVPSFPLGVDDDQSPHFIISSVPEVSPLMDFGSLLHLELEAPDYTSPRDSGIPSILTLLDGLPPSFLHVDIREEEVPIDPPEQKRYKEETMDLPIDHYPACGATFFSERDLVMYWDGSMPNDYKHLHPLWLGPFIIHEVVGYDLHRLACLSKEVMPLLVDQHCLKLHKSY